MEETPQNLEQPKPSNNTPPGLLLMENPEVSGVITNTRADKENSLLDDGHINIEELASNIDNISLDDCQFDYNEPKVYIKFNKKRYEIDEIFNENADVAYEILKTMVKKHYLTFK